MIFRVVRLVVSIHVMFSLSSLYAATYDIILHNSSNSVNFLTESLSLTDITFLDKKDIYFNNNKDLSFLIDRSQKSSLTIARVESNLAIEQVCEILTALPNISLAEPNYNLELYQESLDPLSFKQDYLMEGDLFQLWSLVSKKSVLIAVIDTGVDINHEDLKDVIYSNDLEIINGKDDDRNGYIDDRSGYQWVNLLDDESVGDSGDDHGHGTHMAGIIASASNQKGIVGIHPGATILPLKVFDSNGVGYQLEASLAIRYAVDQGVDIINCSWGYVYKTKVLEDAIAYAIENDVIVIAAVGNGGMNTVMYPAKFQSVIGVGSINRNSQKLESFSNQGQGLDIAISGKNIFSAAPGNAYQYLTGTSTSTAIISGILGRIMSHYPSLSTESYQAILTQSSPLVLPASIRVPNVYTLLDEFQVKATVEQTIMSYESDHNHKSKISNVMVAPSPVQTPEAMIHFIAEEAGLAGSISVYNLAGELQEKQSFISNSDRNRVIINIANMSNSTYIYTVSLAEETKIHKGKFAVLR